MRTGRIAAASHLAAVLAPRVFRGMLSLLPPFHDGTLNELRAARHPTVELNHHRSARRAVEGVIPRVGGEELTRGSRTGGAGGAGAGAAVQRGARRAEHGGDRVL